ncbi:hypothetical protein M426DRAFT_17301 [Hypoxylon sp. CI-4A]|nr:hypothetical protein M426DRAFT_17301 [Hypoxylon sp. CI-4A]
MSSSIVSMAESSNPNRNNRLLTLPAELRLEIWGLVIGVGITNRFVAEKRCKDVRESTEPFMQMLHVCKQMHDEVAQLLYSTVSIDCDNHDLRCWEKFFEKIGPHGISFIRELYIYHDCSPDSWWEPWLGCQCIELDPTDRHTRIFEMFKKSDLNIEKLTVCMEPCYGFEPWYPFDHHPSQWIGWDKHIDASRHRDGTPAGQLEYTKCDIYNDLPFLKQVMGLASRSKVLSEIKLDGCNPLWVSTLRRKLGWIVKRDLWFPFGPNERSTIVNPSHPYFGIDLRNFAPSKHHEAVYDELPPEPMSFGDDENDEHIEPPQPSDADWIW